MKVNIRPYRDDDARAFAEIHYDAVHTLGREHYSQETLDAWSTPINETRLQHIKDTANQEIRIIAEIDGKAIGLGCVVPEKSELRACYVASNFAGKGVGGEIMNALETIAVNGGAKILSLDSSLNAVHFYEKRGYRLIEKATHELRVGVLIDCYKMKKTFKTDV